MPMAIFGGIILIIIRNHVKKTNQLRIEYKNCPSVSVELHDLLCVTIREHRRKYTRFIAVYKETLNNKYYISGMNSYLSNPLVTYMQLMGHEPSITVQTANRKQIEPHAKGRLYIAKELGNVTVNGDIIFIENVSHRYKGLIYEPNSLNVMKNLEIRNTVETNKILEEINNATLIEGLIEFDVDMYQG